MSRSEALFLGGRSGVGKSSVGNEIHVSDVSAGDLEELSPGWIHRVATDGRPVAGIAAEIIGLTGWTRAAGPGSPAVIRPFRPAGDASSAP